MSDPSKAIADGAESLESAVNNLTKEVARQNSRARANRRLIWMVALGLAINACVVSLVVLLTNNVRSNSNRVREVQERTSNQVLCPLYELILQSYNPKSPTALKDPENYAHSFQVIREGYKTLECRK
jgi:hypothetical protein